MVIQRLRQRSLHKQIHIRVFFSQLIGVIIIRRQSLYSIGNQFTEAADILILRGENAHVRAGCLLLIEAFIPAPAGSRRKLLLFFHLGEQSVLYLQCAADLTDNHLPVKIRICNRHKQVFCYQPVYRFIYRLILPAKLCRYRG